MTLVSFFCRGLSEGYVSFEGIHSRRLFAVPFGTGQQGVTGGDGEGREE